MTLRSKLLAAQAPLAAVLVVIGFATLKTLTALGSGPALILKDNYRSVLAMERILAALDMVQDVVLARAAGRPADARVEEESLGRVEAELAVQEHNVTEPGEDAATGLLRRRWTAYRAALEPSGQPGPGAPLARWFETLAPLAVGVRDAAGEILALNQDAMARKSDGARRAAERNVTAVVGATLGALALGLVSSLALTARLLRPLGNLSQTVRRLGEGDLEARARVEGKDEIAALALEFNAMADRLAEYRRSSLGELLQAQQASQAAIDSLPDPVLVLDPAGAILNLNAAAESTLRLSGEGGARTIGALEPDLRAVVDRVRHHVLAGRGPYVPRGFEEAVRVESPDGDRHLLPRATPLYSEEGGVAGVTIVLQDVTRLMRFDELKNDLVATVAHEFRTPLTSLRMAIHLTAEEAVGPLTPKQVELMQAAREDCERLQGIVDDLLDLSRIQSGRMALQVDRVDAGALLAGAATALRGAAEAAGLELAVSAPEPPVEVRADPERAGIVLSNLLANAVRHTPRGGRVELSARLAGEGAVRFEVRDTGEGIAREHLERVFDKFYRVPGSRSGGVGLGLYISREIVHAHGGEMGAESVPGRGSTFWFTLGLASEHAGGGVKATA
ncbi:sensor histidine kinase [Anaeromyxobacter oryzae]|uniref:histidine kinase n=1 Tax=Anaeromyxobacter oryzae TaxID=2918170 RepID=A0ABM7WXB8_9BACT|nr:ATP-binding protein [Anaeromyxobacter oryzae]BDG04152.1 PAS domain-containing sensor histidine kinase [Anaeromyxobacter oryzae]